MPLCPELTPLHPTTINKMSKEESEARSLPTMISRINEIQKYFEDEIISSDRTYKKYDRAHEFLQYSIILGPLLVTASESAQLEIKTEGIKRILNQVMIPFSIIATFIGFLSKQIEKKKIKHAKISALATSKLNSVIDKTIEANRDFKVTPDEYIIIQNEKIEYIRLRSEIESGAAVIEARTFDAIKNDFKKESFEEGKQAGIQEMSNRVKSLTQYDVT